MSAYVSTDRWYRGHLHISEYSQRVFGHADRSWAHVVSGGVDVTRFHPPAVRTHNGPALFVGRLLPHKGIEDLIDAANADLPVEIVGRAVDTTYLDALRSMATNKPVTFRHDCNDDELIATYQRAFSIVVLFQEY